MFMDQLALTLTSGYTWIPLYVFLLVLVVKNNEKPSQIGLVIGAALLCILLAEGLSAGIVKPLVHRPRPVMEPSLYGIVRVVNDYFPGGYSFFSSHAANTSSLAVFFSLLVKNRAFTGYMVTWSLINCWTRLYLGAHFPLDILVGLLWGTIAGVVAYIVFLYGYTRVSPKLHYISAQYTKSGYSLMDIDLTLTVMVLICIYAVIRATLVIL